MPDLKNSFLAGIMNKDLDERLVPEGVYRDALNVDIDTADGGNIGAVKNKSGNTLIANVWNVAGFPYPQTTNAKTIGAVSSDKDGLIYFFVASDQFDGIYEHDTNNGGTVRVLQSNKPAPTMKSKLNFDKNYIITGVNYVNGFLYWTDNYNPPRRINISRVKSDSLGTGGYSIDDPRIDEDINVILAPPLNAPKLSLSENTATQSNNMEEKFLYFAYRYKYVDDQYSAISPFSAVAFQPKNYIIDYNIGNNKTMVNRFNQAQITVFTGNQFVKEIQVIMRDVRSLNSYIVETFNKEDLLIQDQVFRSFTFNNNKTYALLPLDQITRLFDNVPLLAKAQDFVGNRIMYGNYTQFYDIDYPVNLEASYSSIDGSGNVPTQTFRSDRDYELGIIYTDKYGRSTTGLTSDNNTVYIPPTQSDKGNSLQLKIKNKPPLWATNFRIVLKQSKNKYEVIFPLTYETNGLFRYFLINESDREKINVGKYIIFKSDADGPTYSNKKYKILEIEDKVAEFNGIQGALAGLYFKIKVDFPTELDGDGITSYYGDAFANSITNAIIGPYNYVEYPIYYGDNNSNSLSLSNTGYLPSQGFWITFTGVQPYNGSNDYRINIEVTSATEFRWTNNISMSGGWVYVTIDYTTPHFISPTNQTGTNLISAQDYNNGVWIVWNSQPSIGDRWVINLRGAGSNNYNPQAPTTSNYIYNYFGGGQQNNWLCPLNTLKNVDTPIYPGDIITIKWNEILNPGSNNKIWTKTSFGTYQNIEEWFVESGAYLKFPYEDSSGNAIKAKAVSFRRGISYTNYEIPSVNYNYTTITCQNTDTNLRNYPIYMLLKCSPDIYGGVNRMDADITIEHKDNQIIAETTPNPADLDVFHELSRTYNISNGFHKVRWKYADYTAVLNSIYVGKTNLGQASPGSTPTSSDEMHNYVAGEKVYVNGGIFSGYYNVLFVPDPYNIIIDLNFPGSGPVTPGYVSYDIVESDQTLYNITAGAATIKINNPGNTINSDFNAWSYGNGLETFRIRDDYSEATLEYSPRVTLEIDDYQQKTSKNAISYSGVYGENTNFNALNEFNLSKANFKYLDSEFGSIQKLYARDTDLIVFQEDKVSSVLYGKNLLSDAVGGGQVVSVPEVLGTQIAFPVEYGISTNPESFGVWGDSIFFTDSKRGSVLTMTGNQIQEISAFGMQDYFIELMREYPNTQKLGCYDPHNQTYILASNDISITNCALRLNRLSKTVASNTSSFQNNLFTIICDVSWSITLQNMGYGTSWVSNYQLFGFGTTDITAIIAQNLTGANRSLRFVVTYCDGKQQKFLLTQGASPAGNIINVVIHNPLPVKPILNNITYG